MIGVGRMRRLNSYCTADSKPRLGLPRRKRPVRNVSSNAASTRYWKSGGWLKWPMLATNVAFFNTVDTATRGLRLRCTPAFCVVDPAGGRGLNWS